MPVRKIPLVTGEYYHIFNRGINKQPTFTIERDYLRAIQTLIYYRPIISKIKYSNFLSRSRDERQSILKKLASSPHKVTVVA